MLSHARRERESTYQETPQRSRRTNVSVPDPGVVNALESALASDPANVAVRLHLAHLLVGTEPARALDHLERLLSTRPDDSEGLALAAEAAYAIGDHTRAAAWRRLHEALNGALPGGGGSEAPVAAAGPPPASSDLAHAAPHRSQGGAVNEDTVDWDSEIQELFAREASLRVTLRDVAGLDGVKERLELSFLGPMRNPEMRKVYGASMRGGLLLWGPPGCGKTFLARAVAGELGAHFVSVGLHDVLDMWLGNSEKQLHELFALARRRKPTVLFFDEVDAIGHSRTDLGRSASRNVVAQLLAEMDGVDSSNEGVFVIGATNQPWDVDPALRRPGRLDRPMLVLPPDATARAAILEFHVRDRPTSGESLAGVVAVTDGFSGADLKLVCDDAAQAAMADAVRSGVTHPITAACLLDAAGRIRPSTLPWFEMARNYATYANTTGDYDELATYLRSQKGRRR